MNGPGGAATPGGAAVTRRVVLVAQQLRRRAPGGIGTYVRGLLKGLGPEHENGDGEAVRTGHGRVGSGSETAGQVTVTLFAGRPARRPDPLVELGHRVSNSPLPAPALSRLWAVGLGGVPGNFDVVHAPSLDAPPVRHNALVVTVHDLAWRELPDAFPRRGRRWHETMFRRALDSASALVVPSLPVADALCRAGARSDQVHVIAHGSDHLPPPDDAAARRLLDRLGVTGDFLLAVGTLEPRKNLSRLLCAHERARSGGLEPLPLVVVGPQGWGQADAARSRGEVRLAGPVPAATLAALYGRARLLAFVPLMEGFGLPPLEAMAAGTPVLASPVPSVGDAALLVDPYDVSAMADGLVRLSGDGELRSRLSQQGLARAAERRWVDSANDHVRLWESL